MVINTQSSQDQPLMDRTVFLKPGDYGEETLIKIRKGTRILFKLSSDLFGNQELALYTNYNSSDVFQRGEYHIVQFNLNHYFNEETYGECVIDCPGTFHFRFSTSTHTAKKDRYDGGGYITVDPELTIFKDNQRLSLNSIAMITYLPKSLGRFEDWKGRLQVAKEAGYNFIHFTPVQSLGLSNSSYSVLNQLELNHQVFGDKVTWSDLGQFTKFMQEDWGVLSLCDIVLNHTANETPWLHQHPDATYNLANSPHLIVPYIIDRVLVSISDDVAGGKLASHGVPVKLNNENQLNNLKVVLHEAIDSLKLQEFFLIDINNFADSAAEANDAISVKHTYRRFGSTPSRGAPRWKLQEINDATSGIIRSHIMAAVDNVIACARYERIQDSGPRYDVVDERRPLAHRYFYEIPERICTQKIKSGEQEALDPDSAQFIMAHNGWVMNDDPLRNFAEEGSNVYLRRELISWGDSVKLRYGQRQEDSKFLWSYMVEYVELCAKYFHGLRLDNCHSTPIHVAEYLLDCARKIRPNIFVIAELFTNSDAKDNVFVNRLGLNSLVREAQQAWNSHEQGRLLFRYGGKPVGAFENTVPPAIAKAILFDQTHDNPASIDKRSIKDLLPTAALISAGACAIGSTRGYDDIVPHHIHVVNEERLYSTFTSKDVPAVGEVSWNTGLLRARKCLNQFHYYLGHKGFSETFIDQLNPDVVAATRHNPSTRETIILIAFTAFSDPPDSFVQPPFSIRPIEVEGHVSDVLFEGRLTFDCNSVYEPSDKYLAGLSTKLDWRESDGNNKFKSEFIHVSTQGTVSRIEFENFQPGDVVAVRVLPLESTTKAVSHLAEFLRSSSLSLTISKLNCTDLNHVLFRCKEEEGGVYSLPNNGEMVYAGLQGIASILETVARNNDLGHPICQNLREGDWLIDCIIKRLVSNPSTKELGIEIDNSAFQHVRQLPRYLIPSYFEKVFRKLYYESIDRAYVLMNVSNKRQLEKLLALTSVQFVGVANGGALPAGGDEYTYMEDERPYIEHSLSAGLPHFSTGYMRSWGRDTFISLPGLLLLTGRYAEAKHHILSYGSVMHFGLIPNLLNKGNCRYNCRDATWWWLYSIVKYIDTVPNGVHILNENVKFNDTVVPLQDVMHLSIENHFKGISFREVDAGPRIDAHMNNEGFNIKVCTDKKTGFIHGGNSFNCGTWMDKMGSSDSAKNRGLPATPRDGAAVEIQGLAAAVFFALGKLQQYKHKIVETNGLSWSYEDWFTKIKSNFESNFFVSDSTNDPLVNNHHIYKDTLGASNKFGDFQLRPNFLITMVVAPQLFQKENAIRALDVVRAKLISKLGVRTLDESDYNYNGNYWNQDSLDFKTACGFNYHQGPEWLWPMGFYLRARLVFCPESGKSEMERIISAHYDHLITSPWRSLPELTNKDGAVCPGSCTAQAWSCGTLLEALRDLQ